MKCFRALALSALSIAINVGVVHADALAPFEATPDGREYEIRLGSAQKNITELSVFFVSSGNVSTSVEVKAIAPLGTKITARGGIHRTGEPEATLAASNLIQQFKFRTEASSRKELLEAPLTVMSDYPNYGSTYAWYHFQKDACTGGKTAQYVTEVKIDLNGINQAEYDNVFVVRLALKEFRFGGDKVASIKPSSDGKYKGEPILLMQSIAYNSEYVNIVTWANGKIRTQKRIPIVKYVGYKGYGLSLARLKGHLDGGKATFELSNGGDIYGVCFNKTRTRQVANGYPAP